VNPAEFKTAHESLGLSTAFIAERCGVVVGRIWAYERPDRAADVPEHAAEVMRDLLNDFHASADRLEQVVKASPEGSIPRHVKLAEFEEMLPALTGWGTLSQGLLLAEVQRRLQTSIEYVA
jgi:transcriptional regulator with XRE-family HTH domain